MTLFSFFLKGGPLMFVLLVISIVGLGLVINKYRQIFQVNRLHRKLADRLSGTDTVELIHQVISETKEECPLVSVINKAQSLFKEDYLIIKESTEAAANIAIHKLEKGLGIISTISAVAPLVGFLGTVTGMVKVFIKIAENSQQGIDITILAGGIWEALLTTVGGLVIGIPAIIFYNDLVAHTENNAKFLQEQIDDYMIKLHKSKQA